MVRKVKNTALLQAIIMYKLYVYKYYKFRLSEYLEYWSYDDLPF